MYESFVTKFVRRPSQENSSEGQQLFVLIQGRSSLSTLEHETYKGLVVERFSRNLRNKRSQFLLLLEV
jgi:hypothetical protein